MKCNYCMDSISSVCFLFYVETIKSITQLASAIIYLLVGTCLDDYVSFVQFARLKQY